MNELENVLNVHGIQGPRVLLSAWVPCSSTKKLQDSLSGANSAALCPTGAGRLAAIRFNSTSSSTSTTRSANMSIAASGSKLHVGNVEQLSRKEESSEYVHHGNERVEKKKIRIVEYLGECNFTAEVVDSFVNLDEGCNVQLGELGVSMAKDGSLTFGAEFESIDDQLGFAPTVAEANRRGKAGVSLNKLSKAVAGLTAESCEILSETFPTSNVRSQFWRTFIVGTLKPFMRPPAYVDGGDYEQSLAPIIGDCIEAHEIEPGHTLLIGSAGLLIAGTRCEKYQNMIHDYAQLRAKMIALAQMNDKISPGMARDSALEFLETLQMGFRFRFSFRFRCSFSFKK